MDARDRRIARLEAELAAAKAEVCAVRADNDKLLKESRHDALTGLLNKRGWHEQMDEMFRTVERTNGSSREPQTIVIVAFDLDHFKQANDKVGHDFGDRVLQNVADALQDKLRRPGDLRGRLGGDEFEVAYACDAEQDFTSAAHIAEKVRKAIQASCVFPSGVESSAKGVTSSIGITFLTPNRHTGTMTDQIRIAEKRADVARYAAKENGRNCVFIMDEDGVLGPSLSAYRDPRAARQRHALIKNAHS